MTREIDNRQDVIDSRDIIARLAELEDIYNDYQDLDGEERADFERDNEDELKEYEALKELVDECEGYSDWQYGETLIRESYWVEYVGELLKDIGDLPKDIPWYIEIDWQATAKNIAQDYTTVDFGGVDYYIRNC